jgi:hypothetical protein
MYRKGIRFLIAHIAAVTCCCAGVPAPQSPFTANTNAPDGLAEAPRWLAEARVVGVGVKTDEVFG